MRGLAQGQGRPGAETQPRRKSLEISAMRQASLLQGPLTVTRVRSTIRARARWACAVAAALAVLFGPGRAAAAPSASPARQEEALWSRLRRIEEAFRAGDAGALRASFPGAAKIRVDLPDVPGCPASYGPGQAQVVFAQLFAAAATRDFTISGDDVTRPSDSTAFARARWVRSAPGDRSGPTHSLTLTLREEDGGWRIHEIVATR